MRRILPIKGIKRRDAVRPLSCEKRVLKYCLRKVAKRGFRWSGARRRTGREGMKQSCGRGEDGNGNERERTKTENGNGERGLCKECEIACGDMRYEMGETNVIKEVRYGKL